MIINSSYQPAVKQKKQSTTYLQQNNRGAVEIPLLFASGVISGLVCVAAALLLLSGSDRIQPYITGSVAVDQILSVVTRNKNIVTIFTGCSYQK